MIAANPRNPENSGALPASQAVPVTRKINGKALSADIDLTAANVGAPAYLNLSNTTLAELATKAKTSHGFLGYIAWSSAIAPDANNAIVMCGSWTVIAISYTGKIYALDMTTSTWIQKT